MNRLLQRLSLGLALACGYAQAQSPLLNEAIHAYLNGNPQTAQERLIALSQIPAEKNTALVHLTRFALEQGDRDKAARYLEESLALAPNTPDELLTAAKFNFSAPNSSLITTIPRVKTGLAHLLSAQQQDPNHIEVLKVLAVFYQKAPGMLGGSEEKAAATLRQLDKLSPEDANLHRISTLLENKKTAEALALADRIKTPLANSQLQYQLAHTYRDQQQLDKALPLFQGLLQREKTLDTLWHINDSYLQVGEILLQQKRDIPQSLALIEEYKRRNNNPTDPHYYWSSLRLAQAHKALGNQAHWQEILSNIKKEPHEKTPEFEEEFAKELKNL
jgi:tetratricopeptide (TPR) repeat protein